jgi:hypothetical protein
MWSLAPTPLTDEEGSSANVRKEEGEGFKRKPVTERGRISRRLLLSGLTNDAAAHYHYHHHHHQ